MMTLDSWARTAVADLHAAVASVPVGTGRVSRRVQHQRSVRAALAGAATGLVVVIVGIVHALPGPSPTQRLERSLMSPPPASSFTVRTHQSGRGYHLTGGSDPMSEKVFNDHHGVFSAFQEWERPGAGVAEFAMQFPTVADAVAARDEYVTQVTASPLKSLIKEVPVRGARVFAGGTFFLGQTTGALPPGSAGVFTAANRLYIISVASRNQTDANPLVIGLLKQQGKLVHHRIG